MKPLIQQLHEEWIETKKVSLPDRLLPCQHGYNLLAWARELLAYYDQHGIVVRPFDDLPQFRLSADEEVTVTVQDLHRFIISDVSLIPLDVRRAVVAHAASRSSVHEAWERIAVLMLDYLHNIDEETMREELSWKFSPTAELLWAVTWFFMERENIKPPTMVRMVAQRFPYYHWASGANSQPFWEPEQGLCRWEWLAMDLYARWKRG